MNYHIFNSKFYVSDNVFHKIKDIILITNYLKKKKIQINISNN